MYKKGDLIFIEDDLGTKIAKLGTPVILDNQECFFVSNLILKDKDMHAYVHIKNIDMYAGGAISVRKSDITRYVTPQEFDIYSSITGGYGTDSIPVPQSTQEGSHP